MTKRKYETSELNNFYSIVRQDVYEQMYAQISGLNLSFERLDINYINSGILINYTEVDGISPKEYVKYVDSAVVEFLGDLVIELAKRPLPDFKGHYFIDFSQSIKHPFSIREESFKLYLSPALASFIIANKQGLSAWLTENNEIPSDCLSYVQKKYSREFYRNVFEYIISEQKAGKICAQGLYDYIDSLNVQMYGDCMRKSIDGVEVEYKQSQAKNISTLNIKSEIAIFINFIEQVVFEASEGKHFSVCELDGEKIVLSEDVLKFMNEYQQLQQDKIPETVKSNKPKKSLSWAEKLCEYNEPQEFKENIGPNELSHQELVSMTCSEVLTV